MGSAAATAGVSVAEAAAGVASMDFFGSSAFEEVATAAGAKAKTPLVSGQILSTETTHQDLQ